MKKLILFASSALLLFAGCAKENGFNGNAAGDIVTFTVITENASTKAVADNDGNAAKVNHWIMEVRDSDGDVFNRQEDSTATEGKLTHTFGVRLIKGQKYKVLFWADTKKTYNTADLTNVRLLDGESTGYVANKDSRDAFSAVDSIEFTGTLEKQVTLKRPFAQMNIIFTGLDSLYKTAKDSAEYVKFKPCTLKVNAKVPTSFNVLTQIAGTPVTTALDITSDKDYLDNYNNHGVEETIFMDYFFATADVNDVVDVDFSFVSKGETISKSFTNVPFQRNYRTNIKGDLMTEGATYNLVIDPIWKGEQEFPKSSNLVSSSLSPTDKNPESWE